MTRMFLSAAFATLALTPAALADTLTLSSPMAGGTLHAGPVDMSVYWTPAGDLAEVVAYYVTGDTPGPARLIMGLADGDAAHFGVPGVKGVLFGFARSGDTVTVTAEDLRVQVARK